ncbi:MAG: STAS domain-containing protein [Lachnospiraceae bacterium]
MKIDVKKSGHEVEIKLNGPLDGQSSDEAAKEILALLEKGTQLTLDMENCGYVSSMGLRVLLMAGKQIKINDGKMRLVNLKEEVMEVMEMTGFASIFTDFA